MHKCLKDLTDLNNTVFAGSEEINIALMRIKLFLGITRLIKVNSEEELSLCIGRENDFFNIIKTLTEKVQCSLYKISNELLKYNFASNILKTEETSDCTYNFVERTFVN
jgi:hypothetical protein